MALTDTSKQVLEYVKKNGGKLSGGIIKGELGLKDSEFKKAKTELKQYGLVELGRGRGGTITVVEGVPVPEETPKRTRAEIMADAREEKEAKKRENKKHKKMVEIGLEKASKDYPDSVLEFDSVNLKEEIVFVRLWNEGKTKAEVVGYYV